MTSSVLTFCLAGFCFSIHAFAQLQQSTGLEPSAPLGGSGRRTELPSNTPSPYTAPAIDDLAQAYAQWQREAISKYPALGVKDSPLNKVFVRRYRELKETNPNYFSSGDWPLRLAEEANLELKQAVKPQAIPSTPISHADTSQQPDTAKVSAAPHAKDDEPTTSSKPLGTGPIVLLVVLAILAFLIVRVVLRVLCRIPILGGIIRLLLDAVGLGSIRRLAEDYGSGDGNSDVHEISSGSSSFQDTRSSQEDRVEQQFERIRQGARDNKQKENERRERQRQRDEQAKQDREQRAQEQKARRNALKKFKVVGFLDNRQFQTFIEAPGRAQAESMARQQYPGAKNLRVWTT